MLKVQRSSQEKHAVQEQDAQNLETHQMSWLLQSGCRANDNFNVRCGGESGCSIRAKKKIIERPSSEQKFLSETGNPPLLSEYTSSREPTSGLLVCLKASVSVGRQIASNCHSWLTCKFASSD